MEEERPVTGSHTIYIDKSWARYIFEVFADEMNRNLGAMSADELMVVIKSLEAPLNLYQPIHKGCYRED